MTKETTLQYESGTAYYQDIQKYLLTNNESNFGKVSHRVNALNPEEIVASLDGNCSNVKIAIVAFYNLLWRSYKDAVTSKRKRAVQQVVVNKSGITTNGDEQQPLAKRIKQESPTPTTTTTTTTTPTTTMDSVKNSRIDYLPDYFMTCTSKAAKIAVMLYMIPSYTESIRKGIIFAILNGHMDDQTMHDLVELSRKSVGELRKVCPNNATTTEEQRKIMLGALIEIAHITRDRSSAKLAMDISQSGYISLVKNYMLRFNIKEMTIYEPIINKYLKECIALNGQEAERIRLQNQFRINSKDLVMNIIDSLPVPSNKVAATSTKALTFDENQSYFFYKGVPNFSQEIVVTNFVHDGKTYVIETYNDCLFDVIGWCNETVDETTGEKQLNSDLVLKGKNWQDRINMIPFRTKVLVGPITGKALNEFAGVTDIAISWMDKNGMSCRRIIRKRDKKPT